MAVARYVGFSLPGAPESSKQAHKLREGTIQHGLVKVASGEQWRRRDYWQSVGIHQNLKLGLGFSGWPCHAAKQDSGYSKRSVPKKVDAKKTGKASLAEAPESLKSSATWSKLDREQVRIFEALFFCQCCTRWSGASDSPFSLWVICICSTRF